MPKKEMKTKVFLVDRRFIGLSTVAGGRAIPSAHAIYEELYSDGRVKLRMGNSIHTVASFSMLNGTPKEKKRAAQTCCPDLSAVIQAASVLNKSIEDACLHVDKLRGCGEYRAK